MVSGEAIPTAQTEIAALPLSRAECEVLDRADPLSRFRDRFDLPDGVLYLDGNSLGAACRDARDALTRTVETEWRTGLIRSWNTAGWVDWPVELGERVAHLIGAAPGQTVVADGTSINLFKALVAALRMNAGRSVIVSESANFPSDLYIMEGAASLFDGTTRRLVPPDATEDDVIALLDDEVAVLSLTHVNYKTARIWDMQRLTRAAHDHGILVVWDLAHSAGAVPVELDEAGADFAVGCGYKYLNGGPGAPGFIYVARRHLGRAVNPLTGWLGHASPFAFAPDYEPAPDIRSFICGTPQVLSYAVLKGALDIFAETDAAALYAKAQALTDLFIGLVESRCASAGLRLVSPRDPDRRGSHVSFAHPNAYAFVQALIARGVIGDFRAPDIARFGFAPLYNSHADVWDAVEIWADILATGEWQRPEFAIVKKVT